MLSRSTYFVLCKAAGERSPLGRYHGKSLFECTRNGMMQEDDYVPIEVRLSYCDAVNSASQEKRVYATQLLLRYPQLSHATVPNYATYRSNKDYDVPELTFETNYLLPAVQESGLFYQRQFIIPIRVGTNIYQGRIDFYLSDEQGIVSLIESKRSIPSSQDWEEAVAQAKSYALPLGSPSFIVAAPQRIRVYTLYRQQEILKHEYTLTQFRQAARKLKALLLSYR